MRADVFCNNNPIGTIDWMPDACGVQVNLDCAVCGNELLRCYAVVNGNILRVGLPARFRWIEARPGPYLR